MSKVKHYFKSKYPFSSPGDLPNPGIEPGSPALQEDSLGSEPPEKLKHCMIIQNNLILG